MNPVVDDLSDYVMEGVFTDISFPSAVTQQNVSFPPTSAEKKQRQNSVSFHHMMLPVNQTFHPQQQTMRPLSSLILY